jgi:muramoyltetrapeptide carboxypeptidase
VKRRNFIRNIGLASLSLPILTFGNEIENTKFDDKILIKPKALKVGDTIGLITPGSFIDDKGLAKAISNIETLGFKVKLSKNIRKIRGYNAGTKQERVDDLHSMFADKEVDGIWAARGGYGSVGLLPMIDFDLIKANPKVFVGYSDITALHLAIFQKTGIVTFHGPVASSNFTDYTVKYLKNMIMKTSIPIKVFPSTENDKKSKENKFFEPHIFNKGETIGRIIGGNLSLIDSMIGTDWELNLDNKLLFIEDIGEAPYRIDKMMTHINQSIGFVKAKGLVLGVFEDCKKPDDEESLELPETFIDNINNLKIPSSYGFSFGHIDNQFTFPMGILAKMNAEERSIEFLENAVI